MTQKKATLMGLIAIVLWRAIVGLIRSVSEGFGAIGGAALIYTLSSLLLLLTVGFPKIKTFPRRYLIIGSVLFVCYCRYRCKTGPPADVNLTHLG